MLTDQEREELAELRRKAARIAGMGGFWLDTGDWYYLHRLGRRIEALQERDTDPGGVGGELSEGPQD